MTVSSGSTFVLTETQRKLVESWSTSQVPVQYTVGPYFPPGVEPGDVNAFPSAVVVFDPRDEETHGSI